MPTAPVESPSSRSHETKLESPSAEQRQRAEAARDELGKRLKSTLVAELQSGGPASAIHVCAKEAAAIAETVSSEHGIRIMRTSSKLRNPQNQAPQWALTHLASGQETPFEQPLPDGGAGFLWPIVAQPVCENCHGDAANFSDELRDALAEHYPDDHATGYQAGDLRGWFVVEVPK